MSAILYCRYPRHRTYNVHDLYLVLQQKHTDCLTERKGNKNRPRQTEKPEQGDQNLLPLPHNPQNVNMKIKMKRQEGGRYLQQRYINLTR